jgi:ribonuclease PH
MTSNLLPRVDGRRADQLRPISFSPHYTQYAEGSVLITWGGTIVLCNLTIQDGVPGWMAGQGCGWLTAEYALLPRSTHTRTQREVHGLKGRTQEIRRLIGRSLRMAVNLQLLGERTLLLDCDVIQADGGTRAASITGGYIALALGLGKLISDNIIPAETLLPPIAAVSVGLIEKQPVLDLNYQEDSQADVDLNIVKTSENLYVEIQGTAEHQPFNAQSLNQLLILADKGIEEILSLQKKALKTLH